MQQEYVDFRSQDRNSGESNDFILRMPNSLSTKKVSSIGFSNLEIPNVRHTIEEKENALAISEGMAIGTHDMQKPFNELVLQTHNGGSITCCVPATLMPVTLTMQEITYNEDGSVATILSSMNTPQKHGLKEFFEWVRANNSTLNTLVVGAEPHQSAASTFKAGILVKDLPALNLEDTMKIRFSPYTINSLRVGTNDGGYVYCPPLHLQEIISLLNFICKGEYQFSLNSNTQHIDRSIVHVVRTDGQKFSIKGNTSTNSLLQTLGLSPGVFKTLHYGVQNPAVMRLRITPGFYASPPSLFANAVERAIQSRGALGMAEATRKGHTFTIGLMDATYNQQIIVPHGVYTPERLVNVIQTVMTDVILTVQHVDPYGYENVGWVQYTFHSESNFPFTIDFTSASSSQLAFALGFETRHYSSRIKYVGTAFACTASRNTIPCPPVSYTGTGLRAPINGPRTSVPRYPRGQYTVSGTSPNVQKFQLICEPGKAWAVPNDEKDKTFFTNVAGAGTVDLTTRALPQQTATDFREGDILRLTGYHKFEQTFSVTAQSVTGPTGNSVVTGIHSDTIGGRGYVEQPKVFLDGVLTNPKEFSTSHLVATFPSTTRLLSITPAYATLTQILGTKMINSETGNMYISVPAPFQIDPQFETFRDVRGNLQVIEYVQGSSPRLFRFTPEEFTKHTSNGVPTIHIPIDTTIPGYFGEMTNGNSIILDAQYELFVGEMEQDISSTGNLELKTTGGDLTVTPLRVSGPYFIFTTSDFHVATLNGQSATSVGGELAITINDTSPRIYQLLKEEEGSTVTFSTNEFSIDSITMGHVDTDTHTIKEIRPPVFQWSEPLIQNYPSILFLQVGQSYRFVSAGIQNHTAGGTVPDIYTTSVAEEWAFGGRSVPTSMGIVDTNNGTYTGTYQHVLQPYNVYTYEGHDRCVYLHESNGVYTWRLCSMTNAFAFANPSRPEYGNGDVLTNNLTYAERFLYGAYQTFTYQFLGDAVVSGKVVVLSPSAVYSKPFAATGSRENGMIHPTIQPILLGDRIVCYNVSKLSDEATYLYPPTLTVAGPEAIDDNEDGVNNIVYAGTQTLHNPERILLNVEVQVVPEPLKDAQGNEGFIGVITFNDNREEVYRIVDVQGKVVVMMVDNLGNTVLDTTSMKSFRLSPGRAITINHTTLTNTSNYCHANMADILCRQQYWGQELPMTLTSVVPIQQGFSENVRSISITGNTLNLNTSITYENESVQPLVIRSIEERKHIAVVSVTNIDGVLRVQLENVTNLYNGDHVSFTSINIDKAMITRIDATTTPPFIEIDTDPDTTPFWYKGTVEVSDVRMNIITRKITLLGTFNHDDISRNDIVYLDGMTEDASLSETNIISGFYEVIRFTGFTNNGETSNIYINYPHEQSNEITNEDVSVGITVSNAYVRLTSNSAVNWNTFSGNGIRLRNSGSLDGIHAVLRSTGTTADIRVHADIPPSTIINGTATVTDSGSITITKISKNGVAPIQAGDRVYLSGTNQFIPSGPYTGAIQSTYGHSDQRGFDGVWIATSNEVNDSFEVAYDSAFGEGEYIDPFPADNTDSIPTTFSRPLVSRLSHVGTHTFEEKIFMSGYDILTDKTWRLRIFNTADPSSAGMTDLGVGGFFHYHPDLVSAHAIVKVTGSSQNYQIADIIPAVPGFVSKHDDPNTPEEDMITPPVQMSYAEGVSSQLNTNFTGADPPGGHARVEATINNGHVIPSNLLPNGARIVGKDKDGVELSYNISAAYIPGRITHDVVDTQVRTLLNTHRLRLILSDKYEREFVGPITVVNSPMISGKYDCPVPIIVESADVQGDLIQCTGSNRPSIGDRITSPDIEPGRVVGNLTIISDNEWSVNMYPPSTTFTGQTRITFENIDQTVAYESPNSPAATYIPVLNSNAGSSNTSASTGKYVRVPVEGTKTSLGESAPVFNDGRYRIPPRIVGQEIEINAGLHTTAYAANIQAGPTNFANHVPHSVSSNNQNTNQIATWGPISIGISDNVLSVPTVCYPGAQLTYHFSDMHITYGGDYTCSATQQFHADASMMVVNENETRIGILTRAEFDAFHKFRYIFEYNSNNLNSGVGFNDTVKSGKVFFTFSRVFEPRLELLPEHTDALAIFGSNRKTKDMVFAFDVRNYDWPDTFKGPSPNGHALLPRQQQRIGTMLGATKNLFGASAYILSSQWNIDPNNYRLLVIEPRHHPITGHSSYCTRVDRDSEGSVAIGERMTNSEIFMKIPIPSAYNVPGPQPRGLQLNPPVYLDQLRIRVLDDDLTPHALHGRELSISLVFDGGKSVGQRHP